MSLFQLSALHLESFDVVSTDLFDTVLLRDLTLQNERFAEMSKFIALALAERGQIVDARILSRLRKMVHGIAYRAVSSEQPKGDVSLAALHALLEQLLGISGIAGLLREAELSVECRRLRPNRKVLSSFEELVAAGKRIIVTSDTYYSGADLKQLIETVVGSHPFAHLYSSSDLGMTKDVGTMFLEVSHREGVAPDRILHIGDNQHSDVAMARAAGLQAVHLPRTVVYTRMRQTRAILRQAVYPSLRRHQ